MIGNRDGKAAMTVAQAVDLLSAAYISLIQSGTPFLRFPSVMLWGAPGVGKSQGIRQIARRISEKTGKRSVITDVRLLLFNPVDLRGIPTSNAEKTLAVWLKPKIFQMDSSEDVINLLFLDEISAAPQSLQAAAYQITLDRQVGEHRLPDNCIVIAAGNRVTDRSVAYHMPKALANRLCHINIEADEVSWRRWAIDSGIHGAVLGYLSQYPEMLMQFAPQNDDLAFPTPRSWEMVSNILKYTSGNIREAFPLIAGCIGNTVAYELLLWSETNESLPSVKDIFSGERVGVPLRPESLFALSSDIVAGAKSCKSDVELENAVDYVVRLPSEFKDRVFEDFLQIKRLRRRLADIRAYDDWFARSGHDWSDYGL